MGLTNLDQTEQGGRQIITVANLFFYWNKFLKFEIIAENETSNNPLPTWGQYTFIYIQIIVSVQKSRHT
jgi:hypothetical protein